MVRKVRILDLVTCVAGHLDKEISYIWLVLMMTGNLMMIG